MGAQAAFEGALIFPLLVEPRLYFSGVESFFQHVASICTEVQRGGVEFSRL
jgi:hypothetical protein